MNPLAAGLVAVVLGVALFGGPLVWSGGLY